MRNHIAATSILFIASILVLPLAAHAQFETKLLASDGVTGDEFGIHVSILGDRVMIGASEVMSNMPGSVRIFERQDDGSWLEVGKLTASGGNTMDLFGNSISQTESRALIGSALDKDIALDAGAAYIFERENSGPWSEITRLTADDAKASARFGASVALDGERALIGASGDDEKGARAGSAYVFEYQGGGVWTQEDKFFGSDTDAQDLFGSSLALTGDRALIGGSNADAAYIFERQGDGSWVEITRLAPGDVSAGDGFGRAVSLLDDRALIGAPTQDQQGASSGAAYVFQRKEDGSWMEVAKLGGEDASEGDRFGFSVAQSEEQLLISADGANGSAGAVYVFEKIDETWTRIAKIGASDGAAADRFGAHVAISGETALAGAPGNDENGDASGSSYVYDLSLIPRVTDFTLIDASTDRPVEGYDPISDGAVLNLKQLPRLLNFRANVKGQVESVRFAFEGDDNFRVENVEPYALFGDWNGDYAAEPLRRGIKELVADPFGNDHAQGVAGVQGRLDFVVISDKSGMAVTQFMLVDAQTDADIQELKSGDILDLSALPSQLNVRAEVEGPVESVRFTLEPELLKRTENVPPYALFGDVAGDYASGALIDGEHTLTAFPFEKDRNRGNAGIPLIVRFDVKHGSSSTQAPFENLPHLKPMPDPPDAVALYAAYPNPFNPSTTISFSLPEAARVQLVIYDMLGRQVMTMIDGVLEARVHEVIFEAGDLPSGMYMYRLETPGNSFVRKMLLLK